MSPMYIMYINQVTYTHHIHINHNDFYSVMYMSMPLYTIFQDAILKKLLFIRNHILQLLYNAIQFIKNPTHLQVERSIRDSHQAPPHVSFPNNHIGHQYVNLPILILAAINITYTKLK